jgi:hypothetical protein
MATYNLTTVSNGGTVINDGWTVRESGFLRKRRVDFARLLTKGISAYVQNDLIGVIPVRKGEVVKAVYLNSIKLDAGAAVLTVGDAIAGGVAASPNGFIDTVTLNGLAVGLTATASLVAGSYFHTATAAVLPAASTGRMIAADGTIDIKLTGTGATLPTTGVIEIVAFVIPAFKDAAVAYTAY